jgi:sec-independent protein translocase protein TatA
MFEGLLQPMHLILILAIVMIFFGPKKLPELGRGHGESIKGFKDAMSNLHEEPKKEPPAEPKAQLAPPAEGSSTSSVTNSSVTKGPTD